ncbi:hypothetical protein OAE17_00785 [Gammaproteobacteria bacterium]|nr:hypothetical protein [Gammaproteobacteria bacterium]
MNLLDAVAVTSGSFSKNEDLELIERLHLHDLELRSQQNLNARTIMHRHELEKNY